MNKINVDGVPAELKIFKQWVCWKFEYPDGETDANGAPVKPTKVPYNPAMNRKASVVDRFTWATFNECVAGLDRYDGIGFVLTAQDPYVVMDLDACSTQEDYDKMVNYYTRLNSFTEISPSGTGSHVWVKATINKGRNKRPFELYGSVRFITVTGNVHYNTDIQYRQDVVDDIWNELAPEKGDRFIHYDGNDPALYGDQEVVNRASAARNGYKFIQLWNGNFSEWYSSQSEADLALTDILAFYTQNTEQLARLFRLSALGQREKAQLDSYVLRNINKSFDKLPPKANTEAMAASVQAALEIYHKEQADMAARNVMPTSNETPLPKAEVVEPTPTPSYVSADMSTIMETPLYYPKGLVGDVADYIFRSSPRPVREIALTAAIGLLAGMCGSAYNVSSTGLNMYILTLAGTGTGKEAVSSGISKLISTVSAASPSITKFLGASQIASPQSLLNHLAKNCRSQVSIMGECGLWLRELSDPAAPAHTAGLRRTLLDLYGKSGRTSVVQSSIYADSAKNTDAIRQPAFTLLGESTQARFYEIIDEMLINEGFIPRWMIIEYDGKRPEFNEHHASVHAPTDMLRALAALSEHIHRLMETYSVIDVPYDSDESEDYARQFNRFCDTQINASPDEAVKNLWTRAYLKMLKLAALVAVGRNFGQPSINMEDMAFAKTVVLKDTVRMCTRYSSGLLAASVSSENKEQHEWVLKVLREYVSAGQSPQKSDQGYGISENMRQQFIVPYSYLLRRVSSKRIFSKSRIGASRALQNTLNDMEMSGILTKMQPQQALAEFESTARLWTVSDVGAILRSKVQV